MKHLKTFESFSQENYIVDEGLREIGQTITKPFRKRTDEEVQIDAMKIINNPVKFGEIEKLLKNNSIHYNNFQKTKSEYDKGNKMPFLKFILFINNHIADLKNNLPFYYKIDLNTGDVTDTTQYSYSSGPGGRSWAD